MLARTSVTGLLIIVGACSQESIAPFDQLDQDEDGRITVQEAARDSELSKVFREFDANRDGELTPAEYLRVAQGY